MFLGCIADDFTGATDLANNLARSGMRVVQTIGIPTSEVDHDVDAVVIALKSRTISPSEAVRQSLEALDWLRQQQAKQIYFKICSTFDSTDKGNIGPVTEALMDALGCDFAAVCPAFPENHRTVFNGHLFVGTQLLSESSMRNHPLTPMHDPDLVRVLQRQCTRSVGLVNHTAVHSGVKAISERVASLRADGVKLAIFDATSDSDLMTLGSAFLDFPLIVAGSGVGLGLPQNFHIKPSTQASDLPVAKGFRAIVSGSCSNASNEQVAHFKAQGGECFPIDPLKVASGADVVEEALRWATPLLSDRPLLVYATAKPEAVKAAQTALGVENSGEMIEKALSAIAARLVEEGVRQLVVAGGETSGACVKALNISEMRIGPQIDPGVPWCFAKCAIAGNDGLHIALKSGNFGTFDFFTKSFELLT